MTNNQYQPSEKEKQNMVFKNGFFKVSGDKIFATLQGEGLFEKDGGTAGCPAVFFRLQFCNLHCGQKGGWKCDTGYTWDIGRQEYWTEPEDWSVEKTISEIEKAWNEKFADIDPKNKRVVITGGEPLLQQNLIIELVEKMPDWHFEIETNGTITPDIKLLKCQINCSPKLENSGNEKQLRYKPDVLREINDFSLSWFKFVVNDVRDFEEIKLIVSECNLKSEKILIMPEGFTLEVVNNHFKTIEKDVVSHGWRITNRNQLLWFGTKRRT